MLVMPLSRAGNGLIHFEIGMIMNMGFLGHMIFGAANAHVTRQSLATIGRRFESGDVGVMGKLLWIASRNRTGRSHECRSALRRA